MVGPEFVDAKSARDDKRPGFQAMFDVVESGNAPFDIVLVHSYSRFYRENIGLELYYRTLRKRKIELISITQEVGEGSTADLIRQIIALLDEHTSRETAKHVERGLKENARQGFFNGSSVPFGLQSVAVEVRGRKVKKRLAIEPVEADVVRKIFDLYLRGDGSSGRMGIASIVNWLNANGYRSRKGKLWGNSSLHRLLTNPIYKGDYVYNRRAEEEQRITIAVPAIISPSTFDAVQRDLPLRDPRETPPRVLNGPVLLSGVAHCAECGARLVAVKGTGKMGVVYEYYKCGTKHRSGKSACITERNIPLPELDELVTERVTEQVLAADRLGALLAGLLKRQTAKDHERAAHLSAMKERLAKATKGVNQLLAVVEEGLIELSDPLLRERMEALQRERHLAEKSIDQALAEIAPEAQITEERLASFSVLMRKNLKEGSVQFRRDYIRAIVENVTVSDNAVRIVVDPESLGRNAMMSPESGVHSFVHNWRRGRDSPPLKESHLIRNLGVIS